MASSMRHYWKKRRGARERRRQNAQPVAIVEEVIHGQRVPVKKYPPPSPMPASRYVRCAKRNDVREEGSDW